MKLTKEEQKILDSVKKGVWRRGRGVTAIYSDGVRMRLCFTE